ncbi:FAD-binding oxidoreductase [Jatrophihabitans sp. YIM 134969]
MTLLVPSDRPAPDSPAATTSAPWTEVLRSEVRGRVLLPGDDAYPELSTPWNVAAASSPVAVVEVLDAADVAAVVRVAAGAELEVAVRATGHGAVPTTRPTVLVHTRRLDELSVDPVRRTARVGAGVCWQRVLDSAAPHGLAALAGSAPGVGVVGYLTGGGLSPVARTFGYASDHVRSLEVVTGDGEVRHVSAGDNPALFWALRGGKGALGIVTAVEIDLFEVAELFGGALYFDGADAETVLRAWRTWSAELPEQATTSVAVLRLPPLPTVPAPLAGRTSVAVRFAWVGDPAEGARTLAGISGAAPVVFGGVDVMPFAALGAIHADPVDPMPVLERSMLLGALPADAVDTLLALAGPESGSPLLAVELRLLGGRLADEPDVPSAVCHRDAAYNLMLVGLAAPPLAEASEAAAAAVAVALEPLSGGRAQPNFSAATDGRGVRRHHDPATLDRLATLAEAYDPRHVVAAATPLRTAVMMSR